MKRKAYHRLHTKIIAAERPAVYAAFFEKNEEFLALFSLQNNLYNRMPADLPRALELISDTAVRFLGVELCSIFLFTPEGHALEYQEHGVHTPSGFEGNRVLLRTELQEYCSRLENNEIILLDDRSSREEFEQLLGKEADGLVAALHAPVRMEHRTVGVVRYEYRSRTHAWRNEDKLIATVFAGMVTRALEKNALYGLQRTMAEKISQQEFILDNTGDAITVIKGKHILYANAALETLLGVPARSLIEQQFIDFIHPSERKRIIARHGAWTEKKQESFCHVVRPDRSLRSVRVSTQCLYWQGERALMATITDLTSQHESEAMRAQYTYELEQTNTQLLTAQHELEKSKERYRMLSESAHDAILLLKGGYCVECNSKALELFDCSREELIAHPVSSFLPERQPDMSDSLDSGRERISAAFYNDQPQDFEWTFQRLNGTTFIGEVCLKKDFLDGNDYLQVIIKDVTAQKEAERARQEAEQFWITTFEKNAIPLMFIEEDMTIWKVNERFVEVSGWQKEETEGKMKWTTLVADQEKDLPRLERYHELRRKNGAPVPNEYECALRTRNGDVRDMTVNIAMVPGTKRSLAGLNDVTERNQALAALKESESWYRAVFETTGTATILIHKDTSILQANSEFARFSGYSKEELENTASWTTFVHKEDLARMQGYHASRRGDPTAAPSTYAFRFIRKNGEERHCINYVAMIPGKDISVASVLDVTDLVQAQEKLRESEGMFRALVENTKDVIMRYGQDLRMLYANPVIKKYTGQEPGSFLGKQPSELGFPQDLTAQWESELRKVFQTKKETQFEIQLPNGTWLFLLLVPELSPDASSVKAVLASARDITRTKKAQEDLMHTSKMESLAILAGGIAHDFNNILTIINGNISLIGMSPDISLSDKEAIHDAGDAVMRGRDLTKQLSTIAKTGATERKLGSAAECLTTTTRLCLRGRKAAASFSLAPDLWPIMMDRTQINGAIQNFIINADQAMPHGGMIHISAENLSDRSVITSLFPEAKGEYYVKISIRDEGEGISPENLKKVFDVYYSTKDTGSGLGLAMCYSIIKGHKGKILVSSTLGTGTTFTILLPATPNGTFPDLGSTPGLTKGHGNILVMDDEEQILKFMVGALGRTGYTVTTATNGSEAVKKFRDAKEQGTPFDAVVLDLTVPGGMGGDKTLEQLKRIDPGVKAILASGYVPDEGTTQGFKAVVGKPFSLEDMLLELSNILAPDQGSEP